ncbi:MAG: 16S rRNA (uracil(1498)-N(3))-methyltransferase [Flavobacteriaceae bacterium]|nr:MAG: 16S rRNA (uracil(1498)-N(3))-methyltransferase [Flavobacteriaceae bacterium]
MQLFYNKTIQKNDINFTFDKQESKHIVRVLRKTEGDILTITNGLGEVFICEVILASDKKCLVQINEVQKHEKEWNYSLHMVIAPTKLNDRLEWFLEKATEIGVDEITPIICDHSERKVIKHERMEKIIYSAAKQSLKYHFPKLNPAIKLSEFLKKNDAQGHLLIAHCEETHKRSLKSTIEKGEDYTILIGPEGDFSTKEITLALQHKYIPVSLGTSRLRTETAGIVAVHSIAFANE